MSEKRLPRGYAAHPQQHDTAAPWAPAPVSPGPVGPAPGPLRAVGVAAVPLHRLDVIPAEIYQVVPAEIYQMPSPVRYEPPMALVAAAEPAFVARIPTSAPVHQPRPARRWAQFAVASVVTVCGAAALGVGYFAFDHTASTTRSELPGIAALPSTDGLLPAPGVPQVSSPAGTTAPSSAATTAVPATSGAVSAAPVPPSPEPISGAITDGASPAQSTQPIIDATLGPAESQSPTAGRTVAPAPSPFTQLSANLSFNTARKTGTVTISNAGDAADGHWRLTLTIPGGNAVTARGAVTLTQNGESVEFNPSGDSGSVPASGSFSFTFTVHGTLTSNPTNCAIDGNSCS